MWILCFIRHIDVGHVASVPKVVGYPWENPPIKLKVPARYVKNWKLRHHQEVPPFPEDLELGNDAVLTLQPLGSTLLRITEFPKGDF